MVTGVHLGTASAPRSDWSQAGSYIPASRVNLPDQAGQTGRARSLASAGYRALGACPACPELGAKLLVIEARSAAVDGDVQRSREVVGRARRRSGRRQEAPSRPGCGTDPFLSTVRSRSQDGWAVVGSLAPVACRLARRNLETLDSLASAQPPIPSASPSPIRTEGPGQRPRPGFEFRRIRTAKPPCIDLGVSPFLGGWSRRVALGGGPRR